MLLSNLKVGDVATFVGAKTRFIVTERWPEDRVSGVTEITYETGNRNRYIWDQGNPEVNYIGKGKLQVCILLK